MSEKKEGAGGRPASASIAGPTSSPVVHRRTVVENPWKERPVAVRQQRCPQLWREVWSRRKPLQNARISEGRHGRKSSLRRRGHAAMLAPPQVEARSGTER